MKSILYPAKTIFLRKESFFLKKFIEFLNREMIPIEIIDTDGNRYVTRHSNIRHKLHIKDKRFIRALMFPNASSLGEAYVKGYFEIYGNIKDLYEMMCDKLLSKKQRRGLVKFFKNLFTPARIKEKKNIQYHYDAPSEFYRLFLGKTMGYTCGYYPSTDTSMDEAQNEKMDIICRKLRLKKGDRLLDIGCGWGNFAVYAAKHYNVNVTGITLSQEQLGYANEWAHKENLQDQVDIKLLNYRDLGKEQYDKISCVGMSEHVGKKNIKGFFDIVYKNLVPDGLFLQHTITTNLEQKKGHENSFLDNYMFPGGELLFQHDLVKKAVSSGFELLGAENFRTHYVQTLQDWIDQMESRKDKLLQIVSENVYRIYHVFFIGSLISFKQQDISLFQNLFYKKRKDSNKKEYFISAFSKNEKSFA